LIGLQSLDVLSLAKLGSKGVKMQVRWYGHSAFALLGSRGVFLDPFADVGEYEGGEGFNYPPIAGVEADLVLVTHDHFDHNGIKAVGGDPQVVRGIGRFQTPVGEVIGIASEHDDVGGSDRGSNTIFVFALDGLRICHFGDFGQAELRPDQERPIVGADLLFIPVGGEYTIDGKMAATITKQLAPRWAVPMHYRTAALHWPVEPVDAFLAEFDPTSVVRLNTSEFTPQEHVRDPHTTVVVPAAPGTGSSRGASWSRTPDKLLSGLLGKERAS
jgi:L-ascorbate metabolism protein UlaG (beta-lactamase superfamily)